MNRHLTGVMIAVLAATALFTAPAFADHRPGNVVVMGGTLSLTGRLAAQAGRYINARKIFVDELNARGGLLGHKVEMRILDDKSDIRTAITLYEKLITEDKVDLVLGPYGSKMTDPVANVMERYKQPFVAHATAQVIYQRGRKYIFSEPSGPNSKREKGAVDLAKQIGVKRIALIVQADHVGWLHQANLKAATMWRQLKQLLEEQEQQQSQEQDDNQEKSQEEQSQQQDQNEKQENDDEQSPQDQEQQDKQGENEEEKQGQDGEQKDRQEQGEQQQRQAQQKEQQDLREQAQRRLREMMQALRDRKKTRREQEVQTVPVPPVEKDW